MPFVNNIQDNFKKSDSAWGDDNVTYYNMPKKSSKSISGSLNNNNMSYQDLEDMIAELSSIQPSSNDDKMSLQIKLSSLLKEKAKRDELESINRIERDDSFEISDTTVKEDVIEKPIITNSDYSTLEPLTLEPLPTDNVDSGYKTNDILIAGLIVILVIKLMD